VLRNDNHRVKRPSVFHDHTFNQHRSGIGSLPDLFGFQDRCLVAAHGSRKLGGEPHHVHIP
jgi:hypothetical protein